MLAVLLFSAVMNIAALALAMSLILHFWMERRGQPDLAMPHVAGIAGVFGAGLGVLAIVLMSITHPFGQAVVIGVVAGVLSAAMLLLFADVRLLAQSHSGRPWHQRPQSLLFCGAFAFLELIAFTLVVTHLGSAGAMG